MLCVIKLKLTMSPDNLLFFVFVFNWLLLNWAWGISKVILHKKYPISLPLWARYGMPIGFLGNFQYYNRMRSFWPYGIKHLGQQWFKLWHVTCFTQSHFLSKCWLIVNWTLWNISYIYIWNSIIFVEKTNKHFNPTSMCYCVAPADSPHVDPLQGAVSIRKTVLPGMAIPMLKIRRPNDRLIFNMEIAIRR